MRTTIEMPADLRRKLIAEAAARNMKGFSGIIVEALEQYLSRGDEERKRIVAELKGCLDEQEYEKELQRIREGRGNWRP
jgi:predicted transcriptional regulator